VVRVRLGRGVGPDGAVLDHVPIRSIRGLFLWTADLATPPPDDSLADEEATRRPAHSVRSHPSGHLLWTAARIIRSAPRSLVPSIPSRCANRTVARLTRCSPFRLQPRTRQPPPRTTVLPPQSGAAPHVAQVADARAHSAYRETPRWPAAEAQWKADLRAPHLGLRPRAFACDSRSRSDCALTLPASRAPGLSSGPLHGEPEQIHERRITLMVFCRVYGSVRAPDRPEPTPYGDGSRGATMRVSNFSTTANRG